MNLFEELNKRKASGENPKIEDLSKAEIKQLFYDEMVSDKEMAELFGISPSKVTYLRVKNGITLKKCSFEDWLLCKSPAAIQQNMDHKQDVLDKYDIDAVAKAITHFAFRNGPIEDMHAAPNAKLTQDDMKTLNKYMVNRIATILEMIKENRWYEFDLLMSLYSQYGTNWDKAEIDDKDLIKSIEIWMDTACKRQVRQE